VERTFYVFALLGIAIKPGESVIQKVMLRRVTVRGTSQTYGKPVMSVFIQRLLHLGVSLIVLIPTAMAAQEAADSERPHFDFTPLFGYRTTVSFPIDHAVRGTDRRIVFDSRPSYGFSAGMRFHDEDVIEFRWSRQDSRTHLENANFVSSRQKVTLDQFHGDFTHEYILDEWPRWARPFIMGSVGATHVAGNARTSFTRFSFGLGGGVKFFAGQHWGFRMQAQWLPILVNPYATVFCGVGCVIHIGGTLGSQGEVTAGPLLRF
jgi:hypothetical protein